MRPAAMIAFASCAACGTLGPDRGGSENLPNRGVVPYVAAAITGAPPGAPEPCAIVKDGAIELYFELAGTTSIAVARSDATGLAFGAPELIALGRPATSPSVARGADGVVHLAFATPDRRAIVHATSTDGRVFAIDEAPFLEASEAYERGGIGSPSLAIAGSELELVYETSAAAGGSPAVAYAAATSSIATKHGVILADSGTAELRIATSAAGRTVHRLLYGGADGSIGFAAWFDDPKTIERSPYNPILVEGTSPTNVLFAGRYFLYFTNGQGELALAIDDKGEPSEAF